MFRDSEVYQPEGFLQAGAQDKEMSMNSIETLYDYVLECLIGRMDLSTMPPIPLPVEVMIADTCE